MSLILLDQNLARDLQWLLPGHDIRPVIEMGWDRLENGALLTAAETAGFEIMIAADQNIRYQQTLSGRRLSPIVLSTNHWPTLRSGAALIVDALAAAIVGSYREVTFDLPPLRRRPSPDPAGRNDA